MARTMQTVLGRYFTFDNPKGHPFSVVEIAHALSHICRYTGHVKEFYSVAQHSVLVSYLVPEHLAMAALFHDASEAYLGDVSSNLKALLPEYKKLEERVEEEIAWQFGLPYPMPLEIKHADLRMLLTEKRDLMPWTPHDKNEWPSNIQPINYKVRPMVPEMARLYFYNRYRELTLKGL